MRSPGWISALCVITCLFSLLPITALAEHAMMWQEEIDVPFDFISRPPDTIVGDLDGDGEPGEARPRIAGRVHSARSKI